MVLNDILSSAATLSQIVLIIIVRIVKNQGQEHVGAGICTDLEVKLVSISIYNRTFLEERIPTPGDYARVLLPHFPALAKLRPTGTKTWVREKSFQRRNHAYL